MHPLIPAAELRQMLESKSPLVVLDCSFDLVDTEAGERSYREGHLPQALYVSLERDLSGPKTGRNGRHPLRERVAYAHWMGYIGIAPGTPVVAYDRQGGMYAARAWWVLRWMGHADVALLDGGLAAWQQAGGTLTTDVPTPAPVTPYPSQPPGLPTLDAQQLQ